jgi:hypothetical protein
MDAIEIVARAIGAFYVIGAVIGLRAIAGDAVLDKALSALSLKPIPRADILRRRAMVTIVSATGLGGIALTLMSGWAPLLFLTCLGLQAGWLAWARSAFPPQDAEETIDRRRAINAAVLWTVATALVLWLNRRDRLAPLADPVAPAAMAFAAAAAGIWVLPHLAWRPASPQMFSEPLPLEPDPRPDRVRLHVRYGYVPLWDADRSRALDPRDWLPDTLCDRLLAWEAAYCDAIDPEAWERGPAFSVEQAAAHAAEGALVVAAMREAFGGTVRVEGPFYGDEQEATPTIR